MDFVEIRWHNITVKLRNIKVREIKYVYSNRKVLSRRRLSLGLTVRFQVPDGMLDEMLRCFGTLYCIVDVFGVGQRSSGCGCGYSVVVVMTSAIFGSHGDNWVSSG